MNTVALSLRFVMFLSAGSLLAGCGTPKKKAMEKMRTHFRTASEKNNNRCKASYAQKKDAVEITFADCTDAEFGVWVKKHVNGKTYIDLAQDAGFKWLHFTNGSRKCSIVTKKTTICRMKK